MDTPVSLGAVLAWLTGADAGAFLVIAWLLAWLLEDVPGWGALPSKSRALITLAGAAALGCLAVFLSGQPAFIAAIEPYFRVFMYVVLAWLAKEAPHRLDAKVQPRSGG